MTNFIASNEMYIDEGVSMSHRDKTRRQLSTALVVNQRLLFFKLIKKRGKFPCVFVEEKSPKKS